MILNIGHLDPNHELACQAFYLEDLDTNMLPTGCFMDEHGFLELHDRTRELKAGCLIRRHVVPRRGRLSGQS